MQTFLPYSSFVDSANVLDNKRLGKQRVEVLQIYKTLTGQSKGWTRHPAVLMWKGYERALLSYGMAVCDEWISRGFKDNLLKQFDAWDEKLFDTHRYNDPPWIGDAQLHLSHKANLLRKDPQFYGRHWDWITLGVSEDFPYFWPVTKDKPYVEGVARD